MDITRVILVEDLRLTGFTTTGWVWLVGKTNVYYYNFLKYLFKKTFFSFRLKNALLNSSPEHHATFSTCLKVHQHTWCKRRVMRCVFIFD